MDWSFRNGIQSLELHAELPPPVTAAGARNRMGIDLDPHDTSHCPLGVRCEACGAAADDLTVATSDTRLGVLCLTMCTPCAGARMTPPVATATATRLVMQHRAHLGLDPNAMIAAIRRLGPTR